MNPNTSPSASLRVISLAAIRLPYRLVSLIVSIMTVAVGRKMECGERNDSVAFKELSTTPEREVHPAPAFPE